ncbi:META domain-containing protein [Spirabiliibacterium falconis]|uniref:META domain-containing protein n=1 Tax=Spirabiliibacterium falconis TaxID=572023 RepID=UPI001AAD7455|nr:META domain-containing protein [Spirabiliibacterium falconis]MBE2894121.1 META domain-containing protein [Spirabiliibacterium falconis]
MPYLMSTVLLSLLLMACSVQQEEKAMPKTGEQSMVTQTAHVDAMLVRSWQVTDIDGQKVQADDYQLIMAADGKLSAYFGCNRIMGSLKTANVGQFQLADGLASTRMLCQHNRDEQQGINALQSAVQYEVITRKAPYEQLVLRDATGKVRLQALFRLF